MATHERKPYTGTDKALVIGIDVGTTLSGVSYAVLEPGKVPRINPVVRFSGQREEKPDSKVPSVVCYDQDGHVLAAGPETDYEINPILSEIEGWCKFRTLISGAATKDFYHSEEPDDSQDKKNIPRPVTDDFKTAVQVFADFLQYLFKSAKEYIMETERYIDPTFTWSSIEKNTYFVLTHPNGWEGKQQAQMREAAVAAGLVDRSAAADHITFVTEGEASLHFCLDKNPELHQQDGGLLVVDGGGGTIDLSAYSQTEKGGYKEIVSPDCLLQGSIFVTSRARDYFKGKFKDSQFGDDDDVEAMARAFDKPEGAKCMFRNPNTPYFVKFGGLRDSDRKYGITNGKFKVEGAQVAKFFEPAIQEIIAGILNQCKNTKNGVSIKYVLLVGGFGRSDYLFARLRDYFKSSGIVVLRPDNAHLNKAVADGSVSWYLDRYVSTRVAKFSYGVMTRHLYNEKNADHVERESKKETQANGKSYIPGIFAPVLKKDSEVSEETLFRQPHKFILTRGQFAAWTTVSTRLKCYRGKAADPPTWVDREPNSFQDACTIQADMSHIKQNMKLTKNGTKLFYKLNLEVVVLLGFTELKAYVTWKENVSF
ncbi:hypothetical protein JOM56_002864 [Amanita muscaria]